MEISVNKLYLTSGHQIINGKGNGAFGVDGFDEALEARIFVNDVIHYMYYGNKVPRTRLFTDNDSWSLNSVISWIGRKLTKDCLTVDVHFNAFHLPRATGTEVLVANVHTQKELFIARKISREYSKIMKIPNRGAKTEKDSHRKYIGMLSSSLIASAKNILIEICFCTNANDVKAYRDNYPELVAFTANYFTELLGIKI